MIKTKDKIILGVLAILLIGMSGVFITAFASENVENSRSGSQQLVTKNANPTTNLAVENAEKNDDDEIEITITGTPLERASAAALAHIGEGRVTDSEVGDEEGYYEIEITLDNGGEVDVHLDENFNVISTEYEDEEDD